MSRDSEIQYDPWEQGDRRRFERRAGLDRRGGLRWDPRALEKERRSGRDRRADEPLSLPEGAE